MACPLRCGRDSFLGLDAVVKPIRPNAAEVLAGRTCRRPSSANRRRRVDPAQVAKVGKTPFAASAKPQVGFAEAVVAEARSRWPFDRPVRNNGMIRWNGDHVGARQSDDHRAAARRAIFCRVRSQVVARQRSVQPVPERRSATITAGANSPIGRPRRASCQNEKSSFLTPCISACDPAQLSGATLRQVARRD